MSFIQGVHSIFFYCDEIARLISDRKSCFSPLQRVSLDQPSLPKSKKFYLFNTKLRNLEKDKLKLTETMVNFIVDGIVAPKIS